MTAGTPRGHVQLAFLNLNSDSGRIGLEPRNELVRAPGVEIRVLIAQNGLDIADSRCRTGELSQMMMNSQPVHWRGR